MGEVLGGRNSGGDLLNAARDEYREVGMKMSTVDGLVGEVTSKPSGCLGEVQASKNNDGDALDATRDESREVMVMMWAQESSFGEVPAEKCATIDVVGVQMKNKCPEKKLNEKGKWLHWRKQKTKIHNSPYCCIRKHYTSWWCQGTDFFIHPMN